MRDVAAWMMVGVPILILLAPIIVGFRRDRAKAERERRRGFEVISQRKGS